MAACNHHTVQLPQVSWLQNLRNYMRDPSKIEDLANFLEYRVKECLTRMKRQKEIIKAWERKAQDYLYRNYVTPRLEEIKNKPVPKVGLLDKWIITT